MYQYKSNGENPYNFACVIFSMFLLSFFRLLFATSPAHDTLLCDVDLSDFLHNNYVFLVAIDICCGTLKMSDMIHNIKYFVNMS